MLMAEEKYAVNATGPGLFRQCPENNIFLVRFFDLVIYLLPSNCT
jgi:hypothetical protein